MLSIDRSKNHVQGCTKCLELTIFKSQFFFGYGRPLMISDFQVYYCVFKIVYLDLSPFISVLWKFHNLCWTHDLFFSSTFNFKPSFIDLSLLVSIVNVKT